MTSAAFSLLRHGPVLLLALLSVSLASAQAYRSKVYLDPDNQLQKSISQSMEEMENNFARIDDAYSKSSVGRHLARTYVAEKQYPKAIDYYVQALQAKGLSADANRQLRDELAQVYILTEQYNKALDLYQHLNPSQQQISGTLIVARAQSALGQHLKVLDSLEPLLQLPQLSQRQLSTLLQLFYRAGAYPQSEQVLQRLLAIDAQNPDYWRQLTSILLEQKKYPEALNQMALARNKKLPFRTTDLMLLVDLYITVGAPDQGARLLHKAIEDGEVESSSENNRKLFETWLHAREKNRATEALQKSVRQTDDLSLHLQLAQLYMEQSNWQAMQQSLLHTCSSVIADKYVSRANLLLGVSQLKLGDSQAARRSFINATLIGGASNKARQWLKFLQAAPATENELREISPPCRPQDPKVRIATSRVISHSTTDTAPTAASQPRVVQNLQIKEVPTLNLYATALNSSIEKLASDLRRQVMRMGVTLVKSGGSMSGPLNLIFNADKFDGENIQLLLGFPYRGVPRTRPPYKTYKASTMKCLYRDYSGSADQLQAAWTEMNELAMEAGLSITGERRMIVDTAASQRSGQLMMELQLGVR